MGDILTTDVFRLHVSTGLSDEAIENYIAGEEALMLERLGDPQEEVVDIIWRALRVNLLGRRPSAISSVVWRRWDQDTTLDETDYILDGSTLRLLDTGTNPFDPYYDRLTISYTTVDDTPIRLMALIRLVALDVGEIDAGAVQSRRVGEHDVTFRNAEERVEERAAIWAGLEGRTQIVLA